MFHPARRFVGNLGSTKNEVLGLWVLKLIKFGAGTAEEVAWELAREARRRGWPLEPRALDRHERVMCSLCRSCALGSIHALGPYLDSFLLLFLGPSAPGSIGVSY